jgi:hypothetical protein
MPVRQYAQDTKVSPMQSLMQIQAALKKAGASQFMIISDDDHGYEGVAFKRAGISYHMKVGVPDEKRRAALLRALLLIVKAKIVAVDSGVRTFEEEFLNDILMADNRTMGQHATEDLRMSLETGQLLKSLPMPGGNLP